MAKKKLEDNEAGKRYFILGKNASVFWDPKSRLKVTSSDPANPTPFEGALSNRVKLALHANHIVQVDEPEPKAEVVATKKAPEPPPADKKKIAEYSKEEMANLSDAELLALYKDEFEVTAKDEKAFSKKSREERIAFLTEEEEEEEDN